MDTVTAEVGENASSCAFQWTWQGSTSEIYGQCCVFVRVRLYAHCCKNSEVTMEISDTEKDIHHSNREELKLSIHIFKRNRCPVT